MTDTRAQEIAKCIPLIEALAPEVAWSFGTITSDQHSLPPFGKAVCVTINGPPSEKHPKPITIFENAHTFTQATERAIFRYMRRALGEGWA